MTTETATRRQPEEFADTDHVHITEAGMEALTSTETGTDETEETADAFTPDTADKVDWVLAKIADRRAAAARIRENGELLAREQDREAEALEWRFGPAIQTWLRAELTGKKKSIRLFHGVLGYRTKSAGVAVTDDTAALVWAQENLPAAVRQSLDKKALAEALLSTGEALPFARLMPEEEVFYIK